MFKGANRICLLLACLLAGAMGVCAQTDPSVSPSTKPIAALQTGVFTADEAVAVALQNNGDLIALRKELDAANALVKQAGLRANPSLETNLLKQNTGEDSQLMIQGMIPLELGGRRQARKLVARREAEVRANAVAEKERQLAAEVRSKFGQAIAQNLKLKLVESLLDAAIRGFDLVKARVSEGKTAPLEENMALVEVNRLRSNREVEAGNATVALLELRSLLGLKPDAPVQIRDDFRDLVSPLPSAGVATDQALRDRPDLAGLRVMEELGESQIRLARSQGRLDASVTAGYQRMNSSFPLSGINEMGQLRPIQDVFHFFSFGVTLQLPVFDRGQGAIEAAVADRDAARARSQFAEIVVRREVASAITRYTSAVKAMEIYRVGVREQAATNLDVVRQTYELGSRSLLDYIAEDRRYIEIENQFIDLQLAAYIARVEVLAATAAPALTNK